jgi:hypothetical protein
LTVLPFSSSLFLFLSCSNQHTYTLTYTEHKHDTLARRHNIFSSLNLPLWHNVLVRFHHLVSRPSCLLRQHTLHPAWGVFVGRGSDARPSVVVPRSSPVEILCHSGDRVASTLPSFSLTKRIEGTTPPFSLTKGVKVLCRGNPSPHLSPCDQTRSRSTLLPPWKTFGHPGPCGPHTLSLW